MLVEFTVQLRELKEAFRPLLAAKPRGKKAHLEYVDITAESGEVTLVIAGASSAFPAEVKSGGYARVPLVFFERFSQVLRTLNQQAITVSIQSGQIKAGSMTFTNPGITTRLIGSRIADLPIDASLLDTLSLLVRFRQEELEESGLWRGQWLLNSRPPTS